VKYRVLPDAQQDIQDIDDWVVEHFGSDFADRTQAKFYDTFDLLTDFPQMGHLRPDVASRRVRFFLVKPYWIVYQSGSPLLIHRVYHAARDLNRMELDE
jgi:plasmid stabilization system protein ParE